MTGLVCPLILGLFHHGGSGSYEEGKKYAIKTYLNEVHGIGLQVNESSNLGFILLSRKRTCANELTKSRVGMFELILDGNYFPNFIAENDNFRGLECEFKQFASGSPEITNAAGIYVTFPGDFALDKEEFLLDRLADFVKMTFKSDILTNRGADFMSGFFAKLEELEISPSEFDNLIFTTGVKFLDGLCEGEAGVEKEDGMDLAQKLFDEACDIKYAQYGIRFHVQDNGRSCNIEFTKRDDESDRYEYAQTHREIILDKLREVGLNPMSTPLPVVSGVVKTLYGAMEFDPDTVKEVRKVVRNIIEETIDKTLHVPSVAVSDPAFAGQSARESDGRCY